MPEEAENLTADRGFLYAFLHGTATLDRVCVMGSLLGAVFAGGLILAAQGVWDYPQLWLFFSTLALFHFTEFYITAKYNPAKVTMASFVFDNGVAYAGAQALALTEAIITQYYSPQNHKNSVVSTVGVLAVLVGQVLRARAMVCAARSFSHLVAIQKKDDHVLVKHDVYQYIRHPSYTGYFIWAVGTQLMLVNPLSTAFYTTVLYYFFYTRIKREEMYLVDFFGQDYEDYRKVTHSGLPFV